MLMKCRTIRALRHVALLGSVSMASGCNGTDVASADAVGTVKQATHFNILDHVRGMGRVDPGARSRFAVRLLHRVRQRQYSARDSGPEFLSPPRDPGASKPKPLE